MIWVVGIVAVVVALAALALIVRNRSAHNSVDSFRRQIDALGPAARRTVVDQVQTAKSRDTDDEPSPREDPAVDGDEPDGGAPRGT